ncbi:MAG: hypothetical protein KGO82_07595, partial [Bacteroidota bacterium]|nr:hypothetical protein [Bacteroidota bacterium]
GIGYWNLLKRPLRDIGFEYQSTSDTKVVGQERLYKSAFNRSLSFSILPAYRRFSIGYMQVLRTEDCKQ